MKILAYISSLALSVYVFQFALFLTRMGEPVSSLSTISFLCSLIVFGFLSWFHFYKPKWGTILLMIFSVVLFFPWPVNFFIEFLKNPEDKNKLSSFLYLLIPLILTILTIFFVWKGKKKGINKYLKLVLVLPPLGIVILYVAFTTIYAIALALE